MSAPGPSLLFDIHNRRGLGHLMRGLNIARAVRVLAPGATVTFHVRADPPPELRDDRFRYVAQPEPAAPTDWPDLVRAVAPDVVVYDTILPKDPGADPVRPPTRSVYVMRKAQDERQREILDHPWLPRIDLIVVPHEAAEFGAALPEPVRARTRFVGPIVRLPDPGAPGRLRERYGLAPEDFLLTSTAGGGGFAPQARAFLDAVLAAHRRLVAALPRLRHVVVPGPNFAGRLEALPGMTVVATEPDMVDLIAISDLVIAEGGYNTVNEVRLTKTPAVFLPSARGVDDQVERVRALAARGLAWVLAGLPPEEIAERVAALATDARALAGVRRRYADDRMVVGNEAAAVAILELLGWRRP